MTEIVSHFWYKTTFYTIVNTMLIILSSVNLKIAQSQNPMTLSSCTIVVRNCNQLFQSAHSVYIFYLYILFILGTFVLFFEAFRDAEISPS